MADIEKTKVRVQPILKLYLDLSKTNHLHFGMWNPNDPLDRDHLEKAQDRYIETMSALIPDTVSTILDVGAGVGGTALALKNKGYAITSISPDPYQQSLFKENTKGAVPFILTTLEKLDIPERFDLMLMSESAQYVKPNDIFKSAANFVSEDGYVLISDYFKLNAADGVPNLPSYPLDQLLDAAEAYGFIKVETVDVTPQILPTLTYGAIVYNDYIKPVLSCLLVTLQVHLKPLYWLVLLLFKVPMKGSNLKQVILNNIQPMNPDTFERCMVYTRILFQKKSSV